MKSSELLSVLIDSNTMTISLLLYTCFKYSLDSIALYSKSSINMFESTKNTGIYYDIKYLVRYQILPQGQVEYNQEFSAALNPFQSRP